MPQQTIGTGPLQNKLEKAAFGDGSGLQALGQGIGSFVSLGQRMQAKEEHEENVVQKRDLTRAQILAEHEITIGLRDGEKLTEGFKEHGENTFVNVRNSEYIRNYETKYGETPPFLEELESKALLWADGRQRTADTDASLEMTNQAFKVIDDLITQELVAAPNPARRSSAIQGALEKAQALVQTAPSGAQKQVAQSRYDELAVTTALMTESREEASEILKTSNIGIETRKTVLERHARTLATKDKATDLQSHAFYNQYEAELIEGKENPGQLQAFESMMATLPETEQRSIRARMGKAKVEGVMDDWLEGEMAEGRINEDTLDEFFDTDTGVVWEHGNTAFITGQQRQELEASFEKKKKIYRDMVDYKEGFRPLADLIDKDDAMVELQAQADFAVENGDLAAAEDVYEEMRMYSIAKQLDYGVPEDQIIGVSGAHVAEYLNTFADPQTSPQERVEAAKDFLDRAGTFAYSALTDIARNDTSLEGEQMGATLAMTFYKTKGGFQSNNSDIEFIEAQSPGFINAHTGDNATFPGLLSKIKTAVAEGPAQGLRDMLAGQAQANSLSPETSRGFRKAFENYTMKRALRYSGQQRPTEEHINQALTDIDRMLGRSVASVQTGPRTVMNIPTNIFNGIYGNDTKAMEEDMNLFLAAAADPESVNENWITSHFTPYHENRAAGFLNSNPIGTLIYQMGRGWEAFLDSETVNAFFPGAGGLDADFKEPVQFVGGVTPGQAGGGILPGQSPRGVKTGKKIVNFAEAIPKIDWESIDFLALHPALRNDPEFSDINSKNKAALQKQYFQKHGSWKLNRQETDIIPVIEPPTGDAEPVIIEGYKLPLNTMANLMGGYKAAKDSTGPFSGNFSDAERTRRQVEGTGR